MTRLGTPRVELVEHVASSATGIGRYAKDLYAALSASGRIRVRLTENARVPLVGGYSILGQMPIGVKDHEPGSIVHFMQITGCCQMLWRPVRPAVATVHDIGYLVFSAERPSRVSRAILDLSFAGLRRMDAVLADSGFTRDGLVLHGVRAERISVVYPGIDHRRFRRREDAEEHLASKYGLRKGGGSKWLLYVGSDQPRKNLDGLLRAFARVRSELPEARLLRVGPSLSGEQKRRHEATLDELGIADATVYLGVVPDGDLARLYSSANLVLLPSFLEGFGFTALEAMACGAPVVASDAGALPEVLGDAARLVDPRSPSAIAEASLEILESPAAAARLTEAGLARAAEFTWERTVEQAVRVYESLASGRAR